MITRILVLHTILVFLFSCRRGDYNFNFSGLNVTTYNKSIELRNSDSLEFTIDSLFNINRIDYIIPFKNEDEDYIGIRTGRSIHIYKIGESNLVKRINLEREGSNAIKSISSFDGLAIKDLNEYYIINNSTNFIYQIDSNANLIDKIDLPIGVNESAIFGTSYNPVQIIGNKIIVPSYGYKNSRNFTKTPTAFFYDFTTAESTASFFYPEIYNNFYWGYNALLRWSSVSYNPENKLFYVSYAVDPNVYIYDENLSLIGEKILGSEYFTDINPQNMDGNLRFIKDDGSNSEKEDDYFMRTSYFMGGFYHPYFGYYLRITRIGKNEDTGEGVKFSIIIADKNLTKIGEFMVPSYYEYQTFFLVKNGIAYLNMEKYNHHEETKIVFDVLEFAEL